MSGSAKGTSRWARWLAKGASRVASNAPEVVRSAGRAVTVASQRASEVAGETREAFHRGLRGEPEPPPKPPKSKRQATAAQVVAWYANLEIEPGADLDAVHRAWKRLQRKYHPDLHAGDPQRADRATALIQELNAAYAGLRAHLES